MISVYGKMVNGFVFISCYSSLDDHSKLFTVQFLHSPSHTHIHSYSASISSTLLFYEAQLGVQHLAQGHFGKQIFLGRLGIELPTFRLEDDHSSPSATAARSYHTIKQAELNICLEMIHTWCHIKHSCKGRGCSHHEEIHGQSKI